MRAAPRWMCLWPGLPRLWLRGEFLGLCTAVVCAALLNLALVANLVWSPWGGGFPDVLAWLLAGGVWAVGVWQNRGISVVQAGAESPDGDVHLFLQAQAEYLRGHWFESEALFEKLLSQQPGDLDARLYLAMLYRHTGRQAEARQQLDRLQRADAAGKWLLELEHERKLLDHQQFPRLMEEARGREAA